MMDNFHVGIDLGGTQIKGVVLNSSFTLLQEYTIQTEDDTFSKGVWKEKIKTLLDGISNRFLGNLTYGIAAPGLTDQDNTTIQWMPGRLTGLENFRWKEFLQRPVLLLNDAQAACIAEWKLGAAQGNTDVLMITLGTGVGGAVILDGKLHTGKTGRAGHVGHMTVDYRGPQNAVNMVGSLENAIGNCSVKERTLGYFEDTEQLIDAYKKGDTKATFWWLDSVNKLACGLCSLINAYDPDMIVIGGGISNADEALFSPLEEFMLVYEWRPGLHSVPVKKAMLGEFAGAFGAAIFPLIKTNRFHGTNN